MRRTGISGLRACCRALISYKAMWAEQQEVELTSVPND